MKNYLKENKYILLTILLLSSLMFYFIDQKQGFHEDEMFSYGSSNYKYDNVFRSFGYAEAGQDVLYQQVLVGNPFDQLNNLKTFLINSDHFPKDELLAKEIPTWRFKEDALDYLAVQKNDIFNYFSVYYNQARDVHPPMFYFLVHFISTFFLNHFSKYIIFIINLGFFIGTLLMVKNIFKVLEHPKLTIPTMIFYGASMGAISTVMFQRMYMMLTFFSILYLYFSLKFIKDDFEVKNKFLFVITIILGFLTQYYFCIYIAIIFLIISLYLVLKKEYKKLFAYFKLHVLAALIGIIFYPFSINHIFFSYRGLGATDGHSLSFIQMLLYYIEQIIKVFSLNNFLFLIIIILFIGLLYKFRKKDFIKLEKKQLLNLFIIGLPIILFIVIVSKVAPFLGANYTFRYIMLLFPVITVFMMYGLTLLFKNEKKILIVTLFFSIAVSIYGLSDNTPIYLYKDNREVMKLANKYQDSYFVYIYDNYFTHLSSMEEFATYKQSLILNKNIHDFSLLNNEELQNANEFILCIKHWLDVDETLNQVLGNTNYSSYEILLDLNTDVEAVYYRITK